MSLPACATHTAGSIRQSPAPASASPLCKELNMDRNKQIEIQWPVLPLRLMHDWYPPHLRSVGEDMRRLGPPTITCVYTDQALYALEGVHRLHAAAGLEIRVTLHCLPPDQVFTEQDRDAFFDK